ncbi:MAG: hypothetical protein AAFW97_15810 [Pseudomonadota bacterium]
MSARDRLEEARRAERDSRANWFRSLEIAQARFAPNAIARHATDKIKDGASSAAGEVAKGVKKRRGTLLAVGLAAGLLAFRKPIASAVRSKFSRKEETGEDFRSLPEQRLTGDVQTDDPAPVTIVTEEV